MIDKKKMEQIHDKAEEAMNVMTTLEKMQKHNMKYDVSVIIDCMQDYYDICDELKDLINEK